MHQPCRRARSPGFRRVTWCPGPGSARQPNVILLESLSALAVRSVLSALSRQFSAFHCSSLIVPDVFHRNCRRDARDAPVLRSEAAASRRDRVLPDGRLLRDVLRGRADCGACSRADAHLAIARRQRRRHSDVRRALSRRRHLHRQAGQEGLSCRRLRADGGSEEGEGARSPGGRPRGLARHPHRCELPRCPRAGISCCDRARAFRARASAWRCSIFRPASSRPPNTSAQTARQALADELAILRPREISCARRLPGSRRPRRRAAPRRPHHQGRRLDVRVRGGAPGAARSAADAQPCMPSGSTIILPRSARRVRSCNTCAKRRRRICRTCARSPFGPEPTAWWSTRRRCGTSR